MHADRSKSMDDIATREEQVQEIIQRYQTPSIYPQLSKAQEINSDFGPPPAYNSDFQEFQVNAVEGTSPPKSAFASAFNPPPKPTTKGKTKKKDSAKTLTSELFAKEKAKLEDENKKLAKLRDVAENNLSQSQKVIAAKDTALKAKSSEFKAFKDQINKNHAYHSQAQQNLATLAQKQSVINKMASTIIEYQSREERQKQDITKLLEKVRSGEDLLEQQSRVLDQHAQANGELIEILCPDEQEHQEAKEIHDSLHNMIKKQDELTTANEAMKDQLQQYVDAAPVSPLFVNNEPNQPIPSFDESLFNSQLPITTNQPGTSTLYDIPPNSLAWDGFGNPSTTPFLVATQPSKAPILTPPTTMVVSVPVTTTTPITVTPVQPQKTSAINLSSSAATSNAIPTTQLTAPTPSFFLPTPTPIPTTSTQPISTTFSPFPAAVTPISATPTQPSATTTSKYFSSFQPPPSNLLFPPSWTQSTPVAPKDNVNLQAKNQRLQQEVIQLTQTSQEQQERIQQLSDQSDEQEEQIQSLNETIQQQSNAVNLQEEAVQHAIAQKVQLQIDSGEKDMLIKEKENLIQVQTSNIAQLEETNHQLEEASEQQTRFLGDAQVTLSAAVNRIKHADTTSVQLREKLQAETIKYSKLQDQFTQTKENEHNLQEQLKQLREQLASKTVQITESQNTMLSDQEIIDDLRTQVTQLTTQLHNKETELLTINQTYEKKLAETNRLLQTKQQEYSQIAVNLNTSQVEVEDYKRKLRSSESSLKKLETQIRTSKTVDKPISLGPNQQQFDQLQSDNQQLTAEIRRLQQSCTDLQQLLNRQTTESKETISKLKKDLRTQVSSTDAMNSSLQQSSAELQLEICGLQDQLKEAQAKITRDKLKYNSCYNMLSSTRTTVEAYKTFLASKKIVFTNKQLADFKKINGEAVKEQARAKKEAKKNPTQPSTSAADPIVVEDHHKKRKAREKEASKASVDLEDLIASYDENNEPHFSVNALYDGESDSQESDDDTKSQQSDVTFASSSSFSGGTPTVQDEVLLQLTQTLERLNKSQTRDVNHVSKDVQAVKIKSSDFPKYDGVTNKVGYAANPIDFLQKCKAKGELGNLDLDYVAELSADRLEGATRLAYLRFQQQQLNDNEDWTITWEELKEWLESETLTPGEKRIKLTLLSKTRQDGRSITDYTNALETLAQELQLGEDELAEKFFNGLDNQFQLDILEREVGVGTYQEMKKRAKSKETLMKMFIQQISTTTTPTSTPSVQPAQSSNKPQGPTITIKQEDGSTTKAQIVGDIPGGATNAKNLKNSGLTNKQSKQYFCATCDMITSHSTERHKNTTTSNQKSLKPPTIAATPTPVQATPTIKTETKFCQMHNTSVHDWSECRQNKNSPSYQSFAAVTTTQPKPVAQTSNVCGTCGKNHPEDKCWVKHPQLRPTVPQQTCGTCGKNHPEDKCWQKFPHLRPKTTGSVNQVSQSTQLSEIVSAMTQLQGLINPQPQQVNRVDAQQCEYCKQSGHGEDNCPALAKQLADLSTVINRIATAFTKSQGKPIYNLAFQGNQMGKFMMDSGADHSCFPEDFCKKHKIKIYTPKDKIPKFSGAGGAGLHIVGMAKFSINLGGKMREIEPMIVTNPMKYPLIGSEFTEEHNLMVGSLKGEWFIKDSQTGVTLATANAWHGINIVLREELNINRVTLTENVDPNQHQDIMSKLSPEAISKILSQSTIEVQTSGEGDRIEIEPVGNVNLLADEVAAKAQEIFNDEWKTYWEERFADPNRPKIQCDPVDIELKDGIKNLKGQKPHRMNKNAERWARAKIDNMVKKNHLQCVRDSPHGIPIIMVPKPGTQEMRLVVDMRYFNSQTKKINLPLPDITLIFDNLRKMGKYLAVIDLKDGFHNIPISPASQDIAVIITPWGQYRYLVLPQGWHSSPGIFQFIVQKILIDAAQNKEITEQYVQFIDDICIGADSLEELKIKVDELFELIYQSGLEVQPRKCVFGAQKVKFLGFIADEDGLSLDEKIISRIQTKVEDTINQVINNHNKDDDPKAWVRRMYGLFLFYRQFITRFAPNLRFLRKKLKEEKPTLTPQDLEKIHDLIIRLKEGGCIAHIQPQAKTHVFTDASVHGAGGAVFQEQDGELKLVMQESAAFKGKYMTKDAMAREMVALELMVKKLSPRINMGKHVTFFCDNKAVVDSLKSYQEDISNNIYPKPREYQQHKDMRSLRILTNLNSTGANFVHIPREKNHLADLLSYQFPSQVARDFGPHTNQEEEFINSLDVLTQDAFDWVNQFDWPSDPNNPTTFGNAVTIALARYHNMKNKEARQQTQDFTNPQIMLRLQRAIKKNCDENAIEDIKPLLKENYGEETNGVKKPNDNNKPTSTFSTNQQREIRKAKGSFHIEKLLRTAIKTYTNNPVISHTQQYKSKHAGYMWQAVATLIKMPPMSTYFVSYAPNFNKNIVAHTHLTRISDDTTFQETCRTCSFPLFYIGSNAADSKQLPQPWFHHTCDGIAKQRATTMTTKYSGNDEGVKKPNDSPTIPHETFTYSLLTVISTAITATTSGVGLIYYSKKYHVTNYILVATTLVMVVQALASMGLAKIWNDDYKNRNVLPSKFYMEIIAPAVISTTIGWITVVVAIMFAFMTTKKKRRSNRFSPALRPSGFAGAPIKPPTTTRETVKPPTTTQETGMYCDLHNTSHHDWIQCCNNSWTQRREACNKHRKTNEETPPPYNPEFDQPPIKLMKTTKKLRARQVKESTYANLRDLKAPTKTETETESENEIPKYKYQETTNETLYNSQHPEYLQEMNELREQQQTLRDSSSSEDENPAPICPKSINTGVITISTTHLILAIIGIILSLCSGGNATYIASTQLSSTTLNHSEPIQICHLYDNRFFQDKLGKINIGGTQILWTTQKKIFIIPAGAASVTIDTSNKWNNDTWVKCVSTNMEAHLTAGTPPNWKNTHFTLDITKNSAATTPIITIQFTNGETKTINVPQGRRYTAEITLQSLGFPANSSINTPVANNERYEVKHQWLSNNWDLTNTQSWSQSLEVKKNMVSKQVETIPYNYIYNQPKIWTCNKSASEIINRYSLHTQTAQYYDVNLMTINVQGYAIAKRKGAPGTRYQNQWEQTEQMKKELAMDIELIKSVQNKKRDCRYFIFHENGMKNLS